MSPVAVAADRRFRRAHLKPARQRRHWHAWTRRGVTIAAAGAVALYGAHRVTAFTARTHLLRVDHIIVKGNERLPSSDVLAALNGLQGESLLWANLPSWRRRLLASPWVEEATLRRVLPSTVEVVVSERQPIGIGRIAGQMYLVDDRGVIIDEYGPQYTQFDLPIIDGLTAVESGEASGDRPRAELASRVIGSLSSHPEIARRLSQIDVRDPHNAAVILSGDTVVIRLGDTQFLSRLQSYLEWAPALRERVPDIDYVDLRFAGRIYVRARDKPEKAKPLTRRTR